jgi:hypothetical protein
MGLKKTVYVIKMLKLNFITGEVGPETPTCVIDDLCEICQISKNEKNLYKYLNTCSYEYELCHIAWIINKSCVWKQGSLLIAFNFINSAINDISVIDDNFVFDKQNMTNEKNVPLSLLFRLCREHKLPYNRKTKPFELEKRLRIYIWKNKMKNMIDKLTEINPKLLLAIKTTDCLYTEYPSLSASNDNDIATISYVAKQYDIDISLSVCPYEEYNLIKSMGDNYIPRDSKMRYYRKLNSHIYDLTFYFNPKFPKNYYNNIKSLAKNNFLETNGNEYKLLCEASANKNFYNGHYVDIPEETLTLEETSSINSSSILCYGTMIDNSFDVITISELTQHFKSRLTFESPFEDDDDFTENAINKLKNILSGKFFFHKKLNSKELLEREQLLSVIFEIEAYNCQIDLKEEEFVNYYSENEQEQTLIETSLNMLLELSMFMRGWNGKDKFPVIEATFEQTKYQEVENNVLIKMLKFKELCHDLVFDMPLVYYNGNSFQASTDVSEGFSIRDRIEIIQLGSHNNSCIRVSSNWLAASAWRYLTILRKKAPFDITNLRKIS